MHNFGTTSARKLIKGSKDSCYSLESKQTNFEPQYQLIVWVMTSWKKNQKSKTYPNPDDMHQKP